MAALRSAYWLVLVSGFFEPVLYLFSIGVGVGALVGDLDAARTAGRSATPRSSPRRCSPSSAMTGALAETTFNFFGKMKYMKLYDGDAGHPGTAVRDRARRAGLGDAARQRSTSAAFLGVMVAMGLTTSGRALAAFPATVLVGFAFGAVGHGAVHLHAQLAGLRPDVLGPVRAVPVLRHVRAGAGLPGGAALAGRADAAVPLGRPDPRHHHRRAAAGSRLVDVGYLLALIALGLAVAGRRMSRLLCK